MTSAVDRTQQSYDETPYDGTTVIRSHPGRLAAQALWRGLSAPDATRARVLEIGCATGGNILPMAAQLPQARFLGVDLSPVQIAVAETRRKLHGLENVELRAASFEALTEADGEFDYIIAHGVYSWISEPLRDSLMRVVGDRLAPNGIAMVSFNVLPGWRVQQAIRDAQLLHAGDVADPRLRIEKARQLFDLLAEGSDDTFSYGKIWRLEAVRMVAGGDHYLAHEVFEPNSKPESFVEFRARAQRFGLDYLSESSEFGSTDADQTPKARESLRDLSGGDRVKRETYLDIFSGRFFRESLLVKNGRTQSLAASPQNLDALHFMPMLEVEFGASPEPGGDYRLTLKQVSIPVDRALEPAMRRFLQRGPSSSRIADLAPDGDPPTLEALRRLLTLATELGLVANSSIPVQCATRVAERPKLWSVAAVDCVDRAITATMRHAPFQFAQLQRLIGPLTDGTRTRDEIVAELLDMAARGVFRIGGPDGAITEREAMRARLAGPVQQALDGFMRSGLLVDG